MADRVRFGIIGCGLIGHHHAKAIQSLESATLVAVADAVPDCARQFAAEYGVAGHGIIDDLLARDDIDAVTICTPSGLHSPLGCAAARAGKHVLSEKPLDVSVEKVDQLITACAEAGVTLGGILQLRFFPMLQRARQVIADGWLGEIVFAATSCLWHRPQSYYDRAAWRGTWAMDGGTLSNQAIHTIDLMMWLVGAEPRVRGAYCRTLHREMEAEDLGLALLTFPNGAGGIIEATTLAYPGLPATVTVCGERGSLTITSEAVTAFTAEGAPDGLLEVHDATTPGGAGDPANLNLDSHRANIDDFSRAVLAGRTPTVSGPECRKSVRLINDIYRAAGIGPWA